MYILRKESISDNAHNQLFFGLPISLLNKENQVTFNSLKIILCLRTYIILYINNILI